MKNQSFRLIKLANDLERKERFYSTIILCITISLCLIIPLLLSSLLSVIADRFIPDMAFPRITLEVHHALSLEMYIIPLFVVPVVFIFKLLFHKKLFLMIMTILILYVSFIVLLFAFVSFWNITMDEGLAILLNPVFLVVSVIALWTIFAVIVRHVCFRWSLI